MLTNTEVPESIIVNATHYYGITNIVKILDIPKNIVIVCITPRVTALKKRVETCADATITSKLLSLYGLYSPNPYREQIPHIGVIIPM